MPDRVLIANRGEIAVRIARTLRRLGVESVAVFSPEDAGAPHVRACDRAVALPADAARSPYLDVDRLVAIATATGCDAVHPGYGFLAERADAAAAFVAADVTWIGPPPAAIDLLGDKIRSKETAAAAGVPVVPGLEGADVDAAAVLAFADDAGLPLLLKATAGGGGKGMRRVDDRAAIPAAVDAARREAQAAFGRGELLVERLVTPARHVEVQVAVDEHGGAWAIGERECSLQRRHQKVLEEAPAACLTDAERAGLHEAAIRLAVAAGYRNLGTVEFLLDVSGAGAGPRPFFFLEMNARLQVEHPVTELVHGLDLVALQLRIADGEPLALGDDDPAARRPAAPGGTAAPPAAMGHAVEARITAERIAAGPAGPRFLPAVGPVVAYREPAGPGVRVDSGIERGTVVTTSFDPMLMKVIAFGRDRAQALARLDRALADPVLLGVECNAGFVRRLIAEDAVAADRSTTTLLEELLADPVAGPRLAVPPAVDRDRALATIAEARYRSVAGATPREARGPEVAVAGGSGGGGPAGPGGFAIADGWRIGAPGATRFDLLDPDDTATVLRARLVGDGLAVDVDDGARWTVDHAGRVRQGTNAEPATTDGAATTDATPTTDALRATGATDGPGSADLVGASAATATTAVDGPWTWLHDAGGTWSWRDRPEATGGPADAAGGLAAPLPGVVLAVRVAVGDAVSEGQSLVVMESMKMELDVAAPHDGTVTALDVAVGDHVARGQVLAAVEAQA